jgi:hypothetical protein
VPSEALVDLLARVEAASQDEGAVRKLTYPEELLGVVQGPALPTDAALEAAPQTLEVQLGLAAGITWKRPPSGPYWVLLAEPLPLPDAEGLQRKADSVAVTSELVPELREGVIFARVVVGGFLGEAEAQAWIGDRERWFHELGLEPRVLAAE